MGVGCLLHRAHVGCEPGSSAWRGDGSPNCHVAEQNTQPQPVVRVARPACREERPHDGAHTPSAEQQAHAQHGAALRMDAVHAHVEIPVPMTVNSTQLGPIMSSPALAHTAANNRRSRRT